MPSGERIQFGPNVNFLFESHDLSCASPATISRMGMIFLRLGMRGEDDVGGEARKGGESRKKGGSKMGEAGKEDVPLTYLTELQFMGGKRHSTTPLS